MNIASSAGILRAAERTVLLLVVGGVPLFFLFGYTLDAVNLPKMALLTALVSLAAALRLALYAFSGEGIFYRPLVLPAAVLLLPLVIGWLFSDARGWGLFGQYVRYQGLVPYVLFAILGFLLLDAFGRNGAPAAVAIATAGTGIAAYGLLQFFGADPLIWGSDDMGSTLGNSNFTAQFLGTSLPVLLGTWYAYPKSRLLLKYGIALVVIAWLLTRGEGGLLAGVVGVAMFYGLMARTNRTRLILFGLAAFVAAAGVAAIIGSLVLPVPEDKLITLKERAWHWQTSTALIAESPVVGHGPNGFALNALQERPKGEGVVMTISSYVDDAYSVPLSFGVSAGILGLAGFGAFVYWWVQRTAGLVAGGLDPAAAGWAAGIGAYLTQSLFSFDELGIRVLLWTCLAGLAGSLSVPAAPRMPGAPWTRIAAGGLALVLLPAGTWQAVRMVRADHLAREARLASESFDFLRSADLYSAAVDRRDQYWYRLQEATALGRAGVQQGEEGEAQLEAMREHFDSLRGVPEVPPLFQEAGVAASFAEIDPEWGDYAASLYAEVLRHDPWNLDLSTDRARVLTIVGRYRDAIATLEPFVAERPRRAAFWCRLAQAQRRSGDTKAAQRSLAAAFELDPGGAAALYRRQGFQVGPAEPPCS